MPSNSKLRLAADNAADNAEAPGAAARPSPEARADQTPAAEASASAPPPSPAAAPPNRLRRLRLPLMLAGVLIVLAIAGFAWLTGGRYQATDNAYVRVGSVGVSSDIAGRVTKVMVHENQRVKEGDILFTLDSRSAAVAEAEAAAALDSARVKLQADAADVRAKRAELATALSNASFREKERIRALGLMQAGAVSKAEYETAANAAVTARQQVEVVRQQINADAVALNGGGVGGSHWSIRQARAAVDSARLQGSYTVVRAPQAGVVTKVEQLQAGDYVNASQRVFNLVTDDLWMEAAFKENQLNFMRPGQTATVKVDAYPGHTFKARIESIAPGTDQTFSALPAENASGNWVKVVQRVPVRLVFLEKPGITLQGGLSAQVKVDTGHRRFGGSGAR